MPYNLVKPDSQAFNETLRRIEKDLKTPEGGIHRYAEDTYYGGGEWLLLSAWYGWVKLKLGDKGVAREQFTWLEAQADRDCNLPEQGSHHLLDEDSHKTWTQKWGKNASPLLWSHAMYIILKHEIEKA